MKYVFNETELYQLLSIRFEEMRLREGVCDCDFIGDGYFAHECIIDWCIREIKRSNEYVIDKKIEE